MNLHTSLKPYMTMLFPKNNWNLSLSYIAVLLIPWGLIFSRGLADSCCVIVSLLFLLNSYQNKNWAWLKDPFIKISIVAWLWMVLVVSPLAVSPKLSFSVAIPWIRYILLYAAMRHWILTDKHRIFFLGKMLAAMLVFVLIDSLWQYLFDVSLSGNPKDSSGRLTGPINNVKVGVFIAKMILPTAAISLFIAKSTNSRLMLFTSLFLIIMSESIILISGERTAFFSSMFGFFTAIFLIAIVEKRVRIIGASLAITLSGISIFLILTQEWVLARVKEIGIILGALSESNYGKLFIDAIVIGKENLAHGVGFKGFRIVCEEMEKQKILLYCNLHPHNTYLEWFAETGLTGMVIYTAMVICLAFTVLSSFKKSHGIYRILPAAAFGTIIINFFPFMVTQSIFSNWPAILLWYSVSIAMSFTNITTENSKNGGNYT
ncbi:MAG: O-antigen ligase family protein [Rickettsiales bacterium]